MSNLIPPLVSSSPPPIIGPVEEEDDDDFGDFCAAEDSYDCDDFSLPSTPHKTSQKPLGDLDINSNKNHTKEEFYYDEKVEKDFQDKRKLCNGNSIEVNCFSQSNSEDDKSEHSVEVKYEPEPKFEEECKPSECSVLEADEVQLEPNVITETTDVLENINSNFDSPESSGTNEINKDDQIETSPTENLDNSLKETEEIPSESSISIKVDNTEPDVSDDEFGDFESIRDEVKHEDNSESFANFPSSSPSKDEEEDYGDFESGGSIQIDAVSIPQVNVNNAFDETQSILTDIFPKSGKEIDDFQYFDETKINSVFEELKDVTESKALIYQWSKSTSQKMFLKALNIDTRNILYGPNWNSFLPKFASNLGSAPLEPTKSEILTPSPALSTSSPSSSSLKNSRSDIPTAQFDWGVSGLTNPLDSSPLEISEEVARASSKSDINTTSSKKEDLGLFDRTKPEINEPSKIFEISAFNSFESSKMVPLRETHISNEVTDIKPEWFKPTIVTPDLPRKETNPEIADEDEFDDFQMVLPQEEKKIEPSVNSDVILTGILQPVTSKTHIVESKSELIEAEDFTEFQSSISKVKAGERPNYLEPLQPKIQYDTPAVTQINWPDPGVSEDDMKNIELSYSRTKENISRRENLDDEWSDFVSVSNIKTSLPERTATPDLPLSVLNLNNIQTPKQPIPVITPGGILQTKLSSNIVLQPQIVQKSIQPLKPQSVPFQPSIISNQFAANFPDSNDDEWSDFVSSQPTPQMNGKVTSKWSNPATNIIMNPTHFESFHVPQPQSRRNYSNTMPQLDFIAPRQRTSKK